MIQYYTRRENDGEMIVCVTPIRTQQLAHYDGSGVYYYCRTCREEHFIPREELDGRMDRFAARQRKTCQR